MPEPLAVLALLLVAFLLASAFEWVDLEVAALLLVLGLTASGLLSPAEAVSGFANDVVIAIAGLFVMNAAVAKSGAIAWLGARLAGLAHRSPRQALAALLLVTGVASMFVSNVATVALLAPAVVAVGSLSGVSPSRFLLPLAYTSLVGGMATLIGATGNLMVQGMALDAGARPFSMFEFAKIGVPMLALTILYLVTVGWHLVPPRRSPTDGARGPLRDFLVEVSVPVGSDVVGKSLAEAGLPERFGLTLLSMRRQGGEHVVAPGAAAVLSAGDRLIVKADAGALAAVSMSGALETGHDVTVDAKDIESDRINIYEVLVQPRSQLIGRTARQIGLRHRWGVTLLGIMRGAGTVRPRAEDVSIQAGDELLLQGASAAIAELQRDQQVVVLGKFERGDVDRRRLLLSVAALAGVVGVVASGVTSSLALAVLGGVALLLATGQLSVEEASRAVDLRIVVVVACVIPLGHAFEAAGAVEPTERLLRALDEALGPWGVLATLFVGTSVLVQVVQKAAIALAVPLALVAAQATASDAAPFLMAVALASSCAFLTPLAHPVNLMVHAPGQYRFGDFLRVGLPLQILVTVVAVALIPVFWPFAAD
jgi:di/tricarboxylate transporter